MFCRGDLYRDWNLMLTRLKKSFYDLLFFASFLSFLLLFNSTVTYAGSAGSTGAAFLELGIGARAAGRGFADCAWADDVYGVYFNPAGIATLKRQELGFTHNTMFLDLDYNTLGFVYPFEDQGAIALNALYVDLGSVERREIAAGGGPTGILGNANGWDFALSGTYARTVTEFLDLGMTLKFINESLDDYSASAVAVDLGAKWRPPVPGFTVGVSLSNIGTRLKFVSEREELPITLRTGLGYRSPGGRWGVAGDLIYTKNQDLDGAIGGEVWVWPEHLAFRAGANSTADIANGFTIGAGFKWSDLTFDYAFIPFGDIGDQNLISLAYQFGAPRERVYRRTERRQAETSKPTATVIQQPVSTQRVLYGAWILPLRYEAGPADYEWLAFATAEVISSDWKSQNALANSLESARFKVEGMCWASNGTFTISAIARDLISGSATIFNSAGDVENPFEVWRDLEQKLSTYLALQGMNVRPPAPPRPRATMEMPVENAPLPTAVQPQEAPLPPPPPVQKPTRIVEEKPEPKGVTVSRILEYGSTVSNELSRSILESLKRALDGAGILNDERSAAFRFESTYSELSDGTLVVYGRVIDRATGIPIGTIEIYGSRRNIRSLGGRIADAIMVKIPR